MLKNERGVGLIEVMASLVIFLLITIGLINFFLNGIRSNADAEHRAQATGLAKGKMEAIETMNFDDITPAGLQTQWFRYSPDRRLTWGQTGDRFTVATTIPQSWDTDSDGEVDLKQVVVTVSWIEGNSFREVEVETIIADVTTISS
ncbi:MAG: prepilin-type N-terminal cleavage/methylation domain-containing protein [Candidatus Bipolaricaulia bacterium]